MMVRINLLFTFILIFTLGFVLNTATYAMQPAIASKSAALQVARASRTVGTPSLMALTRTALPASAFATQAFTGTPPLASPPTTRPASFKVTITRLSPDGKLQPASLPWNVPGTTSYVTHYAVPFDRNESRESALGRFSAFYLELRDTSVSDDIADLLLKHKVLTLTPNTHLPRFERALIFRVSPQGCRLLAAVSTDQATARLWATESARDYGPRVVAALATFQPIAEPEPTRRIIGRPPFDNDMDDGRSALGPYGDLY